MLQSNKHKLFTVLLVIISFTFIISVLYLVNIDTSPSTIVSNSITSQNITSQEIASNTFTTIVTNNSNAKELKLAEQISQIDNFFATGNVLQVGSIESNKLSLCGTGGNKISFQASTETGTDDQVLTLPTSTTEADTYLKNDGTGNLSWSIGGGGSSDPSNKTITELYSDDTNPIVIGDNVNTIITSQRFGNFQIVLPQIIESGIRFDCLNYSDSVAVSFHANDDIVTSTAYDNYKLGTNEHVTFLGVIRDSDTAWYTF